MTQDGAERPPPTSLSSLPHMDRSAFCQVIADPTTQGEAFLLTEQELAGMVGELKAEPAWGSIEDTSFEEISTFPWCWIPWPLRRKSQGQGCPVAPQVKDSQVPQRSKRQIVVSTHSSPLSRMSRLKTWSHILASLGWWAQKPRARTIWRSERPPSCRKRTEAQERMLKAQTWQTSIKRPSS